MAEYIDKQKAIDAVTVRNLHPGIVNALQSLIIEIPAADVQPVRHGRWENSKASFGEMCSECKFIVWWDDDGPHKFNYCPNCGAKMDGEE